MIELDEHQLKEMQKLIDYHIREHKHLQPLQAIQEMAELQKELTTFMINIELGKTVNYLELFNELFDAWILLGTIYDIFVKNTQQEDMFSMVAGRKIQREKTRWRIE